MSRNTEYQFVPTDTREVEARMIASYAEKSKQTVRPASPERLFIDWVASAFWPFGSSSTIQATRTYPAALRS